MPLLIIISASIAGFLLTIVAIVIVVTCKKVAKTKSDNTSWSQSSRQIQPDRLSNSSNDSNMHSSNTTSSLSTVEDIEGCSDILQEFRGSGHYLKSPVSDSSKLRSYSNGGGASFSDFRQFTSEHDLLDHAARYSSDYHNPYLQAVTPTTDLSSGKKCHCREGDHIYLCCDRPPQSQL